MLADRADLRINCFGHLGDGNLHFNLFPVEGKTRDAYDAIRRGVVLVPKQQEGRTLTEDDASSARDAAVAAELGQVRRHFQRLGLAGRRRCALVIDAARFQQGAERGIDGAAASEAGQGERAEDAALHGAAFCHMGGLP